MAILSAFQKNNFARVTLKLAAVCLFLSLGSLIFGYGEPAHRELAECNVADYHSDTSSFGGVNAIPAFDMQFGTKGANGIYSLSPVQASLMQSIAFVGKSELELTVVVLSSTCSRGHTHRRTAN
jgi:hypothetical protein